MNEFLTKLFYLVDVTEVESVMSSFINAREITVRKEEGMKLGGAGFNKVVVVCALVSLSAQAQVVSKIKGVFYGDYTYNAQNHDTAQEDINAFSIRRVYFTFENNISKNIKTRFRLESAHDKYGESSKINPFVKHAYLEWSNLIPNHKLYLGIAETNAFKNAENLWGYRSIEKTIMDLQKISSSADMGIALKGDLSEKVHHWLTLMNGTGYGSSEVDPYKKIGYAFWMTPVEGLILEGYADYEKQDPDKPAFKYGTDYTGSKGYYTFKTLIGYSGLRYSIGLEMFQRTNQESGIKNIHIENDMIVAGDKADVKKTGFSVFGSLITPIPKLKVFGRYDYYDANAEDDVATAYEDGVLSLGKDNEVRTLFAGLDYIPVGNLHFMPNIIYSSYTKSGKDADITARFTVYYKFDTGKIVVE